MKPEEFMRNAAAKERRRYALLQAAAIVLSANFERSERSGYANAYIDHEDAVNHAAALLTEIERREK